MKTVLDTIVAGTDYLEKHGVEDARLNDGLLVIDLVREVPEAMKPKSISIKTGQKPTVVEDKRDDGEAQAA